MKTRLESLGAYTPEKIVSTQDLMKQMEHELPFPVDLERITGIKTRRWRAENETSGSVALNAARECLKHSRYKPENIDIILSTSISRTLSPFTFHMDPGLSYYYKKELGATSARHFDISNACAGMLTGAYLLDNMIKAGMVKNGMVISGEVVTPISESALREITEPISEQFASLTVGDAGAAFIMDAAEDEEEGIDYIDFTTMADYAHYCIGKPSDKTPGPAMFTKSKEMHDSKVFEQGVEFIKTSMGEYGVLPASLDYIITHQVTVGMVKAYLRAFTEAYNLSSFKTLTTVEDYGNTGSTSLFLVLYNALREKKVSRGTRLLLISAASGITIGTLALTLGSMGE